jgi:hypothetical protein
MADCFMLAESGDRGASNGIIAPTLSSVIPGRDEVASYGAQLRT